MTLSRRPIDRPGPSACWGCAMAGLLALALALGCAKLPAPLPEGWVDRPEEEYRIGADDRLRVSVWRQPELTLDSVVVRPDGRISVPLLDDVRAQGKTPEELKLEIAELLSEFVREPSVTVVVLESRSRLVYMAGEIARKGALTLRPGMRVGDAISDSGGLGPFADAHRIRVVREIDGVSMELEFDYAAFLNGDGVQRNVMLRPGDRIVVRASTLF